MESEVQALFWSDTYNGIGGGGLFQPDCVIDVSAHWQQKLTAINAHSSQNPGVYTAMITRQCAMHGARSGVLFAEGFRRAPLFGRARRASDSLWRHV